PHPLDYQQIPAEKEKYGGYPLLRLVIPQTANPEIAQFPKSLICAILSVKKTINYKHKRKGRWI
ncbi:MAG: hypothetical protein IJ733_10055, partial [Lachnospiraceae bacterium]|nr:hypothetical protein [Lachnospiraceae bacterium]